MTQYEAIQIFAGFVGCLGFAILFNIRGSRLLVAGIGGFLSWMAFVLLSHVIPSDAINYFLVAMLISFYAEIMARVLKTPTTTFITTSLIPLIPGGSLYYTMAYAFGGQVEEFVGKGVYTLQLASALALGIILATTLARGVSHVRELVKKNRG